MKSVIAALLNRFFHSALGQSVASAMVAATQYRVFAPRTVHAMRFDLLRLAARRKSPQVLSPESDRLHVGCGDRRIGGWTNVDVTGSDVDIDLSGGHLPWPDSSFSVIVSQHVIEHLLLHAELLPLLRELRRVLRPGGEIWLSCPDMEKVWRAYAEDRAQAMLARTISRASVDLGMGQAPSQHYVNLVFDQMGEHKNLFDFELLRWAMTEAGFSDGRRVSEPEFLSRFPEFPPRNDDYLTLFMHARAAETRPATGESDE